MQKPKRTKIIATLGPASNNADTMRELINEGVNLLRVNFSHGSHEEHAQLIRLAREVASSSNQEIAIIADLQGPKIRIGQFIDGKITLNNGDQFIIDSEHDISSGTQDKVGTDYHQLAKDVKADDILILSDGLIKLQVIKTQDKQIICKVLTGGVLSNNKGINLQGGGLSAAAITPKDIADLKVALQEQVDYIAISFPKNKEDIIHARDLIHQHQAQTKIIAKIERVEALKNIDEIIIHSDAVMVARGDLGIEIGLADVPAAQKHIIHRARCLNKAVITATQMLESMINLPVATRAEVSDIANAVLDGTDAVMLSAETAVGQYPVNAVKTMYHVCTSAEQNPLVNVSKHRLECTFERADEAIAMATMYTANHLSIKAIITLTESGATPLLMSRIRSGIPIYALTRNISTLRTMNLYRGVYPLSFDPTKIKKDKINKEVIKLLLSKNIVVTGDRIILTKGNSMGELGGTNALKIIQIGEDC